MRRSVITLTVLLALTAIVPASFAAETPAVAAPAVTAPPTSSNLTVVTPPASRPDSYFALWLQAQTGPVANPSDANCCPHCYLRGLACCVGDISTGCYCDPNGC
ncbi:MAG: hypothetical protein QOJ16_909 [Acidobacteriota bacterium]|jgi:hypothetical protein|nr:hypothetical protein [Acidobacteriota bacterium]